MDTSPHPALPNVRVTELFDRLDLPLEGRRLVRRAMLEAPVRDVTSSGRNVVSHFHSPKNGRWLATESRHVEYPAAVRFENDASVIAYFAQPFTRVFEYVDPDTGEIHTRRYTPDFLVLGEDRIEVVECKPHATLLKEAQRHPHLFRQADDGTWYSPMLEAELGKLGLSFRITTDQSFSAVWVANCEHLADYMGDAAEPCPDEVISQVRELLKEEGRMTLHELVSAPHNLSADHLLKAIVDSALVANLDEEPLYDPRCAWLYRDATFCEFIRTQRDVYQPGKPSFVIDIGPGARFQYGAESLIVELLSEKKVVLSRLTGPTMEVDRDWLMRALDNGQLEAMAGADGGPLRYQDYSEDQLATALHRQRVLDGVALGKAPSSRTLSRFRAEQAAARASGGNEVLALAPKVHLRGNRTVRLDKGVLAIMEDVYATVWRDASAKSYQTCHLELQVKCAVAGVKAPSYPTLISFIKKKKTDADVRTRQSARYEYQQRAFVDHLTYEAPVHGSRPFQCVHIDHTELDLECVSARNGRPLGRPWLTIATCATTRRIVGLYLTYMPPSYRSVMMVIRDMVRRHGRLPEFVVVDNGSDLKGTAFKAFLESMGCHMRLRPKGSPRHGAVMERLFGRANTEYIHNLAGNTKATKHVRMVTGKSLPENNAEWTLEQVFHGLSYWAFVYYHDNEHPALGETPNRADARLQRECGSRPQRRVLFNRDFLIATCPPVDRRGTRTVNRQTGVKVWERHYWHASFRAVDVADSTVPVREDPFDASSVYAWVKGEWVQARSRRLAHLPPMSSAAFEALSAEYQRKFKPAVSEAQEIQRIAEFVKTFTPEGATAMYMLRIAESDALVMQLGGGPITPYERLPFTAGRVATTVPQLGAVGDDGDLLIGALETSRVAVPRIANVDLDDFDSF
jgi:putative transposase